MSDISIRQQIKNKLVEYLTGIVINGKEPGVILNDPYSIEEESELPVICIQISNESINEADVGYPRGIDCQLNIEITALYQATNDLDNIIEDFATKIQMELAKTEQRTKLDTTTGLISYCSVESVEFRQFSEIATQTAGAVINYTVKYLCSENDLYADI